MREITLTPYKVKVRALKNDLIEIIEQDYNVKESCAEVLFTRTQNINAREAILREKIAKKIESCESDSILLEDADWNKLRDAVESLSNVGRNDLEFVTRVLDAPSVEVDKKNA